MRPRASTTGLHPAVHRGLALRLQARHDPVTMFPSFNTAGPCIPGEHYMLPPEKRFGHVMRLVDERRYFVLRAGRQTGKSTSARWLCQRFNAGDRYTALWVDVQTAREEPDPAKAFLTVLGKLDWALDMQLPKLQRPNAQELLRDPRTCLLRYLSELSSRAPRPLVVLFDEADCLVGQSMVLFLTQLRDGYIARADMPFPHALALIGLRDVRDFAISTDDRRAVAWLGTSSPFNITTETATLEPFTREDVEELLSQHTANSGQVFKAAAVEQIWYLSQGHPWLVNAIADQITNRDVEDRSIAITEEHVESAKETIIVQRRSHIDSLIAKLREPRVQRIVEPMILGGRITSDTIDDDFAYVLGLGLVTKVGGRVDVANPVYREVIIRELTWAQQVQMIDEPAWYVRADGSLDLGKLFAAWQKFWRIDGHLAAAGFHYREAGPHLVLMAFLQRIINGGGQIHREYGLGRGALDLLVEWGGERHAIELKLRRDTETEEEAFDQLVRYLDVLGLSEGWLVLFDMRANVPWEKKLYLREVEQQGKLIRVVGC